MGFLEGVGIFVVLVIASWAFGLSIMSVNETFNDNIKFCIGNGKKVFFWKDI